jgi:hypothetical protein
MKESNTLSENPLFLAAQAIDLGNYKKLSQATAQLIQQINNSSENAHLAQSLLVIADHLSKKQDHLFEAADALTSVAPYIESSPKARNDFENQWCSYVRQIPNSIQRVETALNATFLGDNCRWFKTKAVETVLTHVDSLPDLTRKIRAVLVAGCYHYERSAYTTRDSEQACADKWIGYIKELPTLEQRFQAAKHAFNYACSRLDESKYSLRYAPRRSLPVMLQTAWKIRDELRQELDRQHKPPLPPVPTAKAAQAFVERFARLGM